MTDCYQPTRLVFLLDNSVNIGSDGFAKSKDFIKSIGEYFDAQSANVAVLDFATKSQVKVAFESKRTVNALKTKINVITYEGRSGHSIHSAFEGARDYLASNGINKPGGKFVILITAAQPTTTTERTLAAFWPNIFNGSRVKAFVVGAGSKVQKSELRKYASAARYVYVADDFDDIVGFVTSIRTAVCSIASRS